MIDHNHLLVMGNITNHFKERAAEIWMAKLVSDLGMSILIPPRAVYCGTIGNKGLTCICAIETSHIVLHQWDEVSPGFMQLDVYTCAALDVNIVWDAIEVFNSTNLQYKFYDRKSGFKLIEQSDAGLDNDL